MSERQKRKKAKELEKASMTPKEPPTKLQKSITHWLRKNVPTKKTKFLHAHVVEYFAASKAIGNNISHLYLIRYMDCKLSVPDQKSCLK